MHGSAAPTPFVGLDIGTTAVRCVVGMVDQHDPGKLSIVAHGSAPNMGMRKGVVAHVEEVADAVAQAINDAERLSGISLHAATINVNGSHVSGLNSKGVVAISTADREITVDDRLRVEEAATIVQLPSNREIIQVFAQNYSLDGQENIKDPVGMHGVRLEVDAHIVTAATPNLRSLEMALGKAQVHINNRTLSGLAAAEAVLSRQQKEAGTALLDIGASTTNLVVIEDGEVQHVAILPIGGQHITNDLAIGLRTDLDVAELVKIQYAGLLQSSIRRDARVKVNNQDYIFKTEDIAMVTEARVEELFEYVDRELSRAHRSHKLPGGVVLVGGGSQLPGIADYAKQELKLAARVGKLQPMTGLIDTIADPSYCTAAGLMLLDMLLVPEPTPTRSGRAADKTLNLIGSLWRRFRA